MKSPSTWVAVLASACLLASCRSAGHTATPRSAQIPVGELTFDALVAGPEDGELVFLLHGFPQTSYSFRHQIPVLAEAGFRIVAPDQRGYSPGARPEEVKSYIVQLLADDVVGMADELGYETFHVVGHDWGAAVAWFTALYNPERVSSIAAISVPHPFAFAEALADPGGEQARMSSYMDVLRAEDAEEQFLADDAALLRSVYAGANLTEEEVQVYVDALGSPEALGAALNWYRAMSLGTRTFRMIAPIRMPAMYVWSTADRALGRTGAELCGKYVEGPYRFEVLEGVSHWVPEEATDRLNVLLLEHLTADG